MKRTDSPMSLHSRLLTAVLLCWILPVLIVIVLAGSLIGNSYERSSQMELKNRAENALEQIGIRFNSVLEASKAVSYDGVVRNSYRLYQRNRDNAALYRTVTEYLNQNFTRDERILAGFISFWEDVEIRPYVASRGDFGYSAQREYREQIEQDLLEKMKDVDTGILLLEYDGELYVARNLLDSRFQPYASIVLLCDKEVLFQSLEPIHQISDTVTLLLDDRLLLTDGNNLCTISQTAGLPEGQMFSDTFSGHTFCLTADVKSFDFWRDVPEIRTAGLAVALLVIPLLFVVLLLFRRYVARPMDILVQASRHLQKGERGYHIEEKAESREFETLFEHFNSMSTEMKYQFEHSYQEQQALQQAQIKALQFQINPHFLNNTLEIINWEARLAENDRVSAMIEALSTLMDGALARDGRSQILLREELRYTDAYLYIIQERLGDRLKVEKEIAAGLEEVPVPRLVLQPLAENAVEYDLTPRRGGMLCLRVKTEEGKMIMEVEHDGVMTEEDRHSVEAMLVSADTDSGISGHVGIRNVSQRLRLLYGDRGTIQVMQATPDKILARVSFPI
ncbi:MAG: histidine kinase [Oscillospiraceae bacterium]|nr:histidine kinase [Oscillospiraceae bacterium]MBR0391345.1 histidine kinase [Oscillospiraceae bacterium]